MPRFYQRDARGMPTGWLATVRQAIMTVAPTFSARRMVREYAENDVRRRRSGARRGRLEWPVASRPMPDQLGDEAASSGDQSDPAVRAARG